MSAAMVGLAMIDRRETVADLGWLRLTGRLAWLF